MTILGYFILSIFAAGALWFFYNVRKKKIQREREARIEFFESTYPETFVAIDTETATNKDDVCQLGYAVVEKGEIVASKAYLVKPIGNKYQIFYTNIHGMNSTTTKDSPGIAEIWPEFESLIQRYGYVAMHNAEFHIKAILDSLKRDGWKSKALYDAEIVDTSELTRLPLRYCIKEYNLDIEFKQDALCHAVACAKLLIELRAESKPRYIPE